MAQTSLLLSPILGNAGPLSLCLGLQLLVLCSQAQNFHAACDNA